MKKVVLKPKHRDTVLFKVQANAKAISFFKENIEPKFSSMEEWEIKEYKLAHEIAKQTLKKLNDFMIENESVFNEMLFEYNLTVTTFIAINS